MPIKVSCEKQCDGTDVTFDNPRFRQKEHVRHTHAAARLRHTAAQFHPYKAFCTQPFAGCHSCTERVSLCTLYVEA